MLTSKKHGARFAMAIDRSSMCALILAGCAMATVSPTSAGEAKPEKRDIPADYSTVTCSNEASARAMISDYYRPNDNGAFDVYRFFDGLKVTGCQQAGGPIVIEEVLARKRVGATHQILYRGSRSTGATVFGLVDEEGNNRAPRNAFERWIATYATGGFLNPDPQKSPAQKPSYLCPTPQAAQKVISAIPAVQQPGVMNAPQVSAKLAALNANGCTIASGRFEVIAVHGSVFISLGYESGETWTALTALDSHRRVVGILHDDDLMTDWN
ncbi:hypothetical protein ACFFF7_12030 [Novosphingobium aquiterrae]|uniref:Uncharacterized protein n=1 Tax=Novosphingobium aquiterrae TaxID=624388 RepID=A0ABV6PJX7_9SPHN